MYAHLLLMACTLLPTIAVNNIESTLLSSLTTPHSLSGIENFHLSFQRDDDAAATTLKGRRLTKERAPFGTKITLHFNVVGEKSYGALALDLHEDLLGRESDQKSSAQYTSHRSDGTKHRDFIPNYTYKGVVRSENEQGGGAEIGWIRATIVSKDAAFIFLYDYLKGDLLVIEPTDITLSQSPNNHHARRLHAAGHVMVAYMHDADASKEHQEEGVFKNMHRMLREHGVSKAYALVQTSHGRHLQAQMPTWLRDSVGQYKGLYGRLSGCPAIQKRLKMGIGIDSHFYSAVTKSTTSTPANDMRVLTVLQSMLSITNVIYVDQVNVFIEFAESYLANSPPPSGPAWNNNGDRLTKFLTEGRDWVRSGQSTGTTNTYGIWHFLTGKFF